MLYIVSYIDSRLNDQLLNNILLLFVANRLIPKATTPLIVRYKPMFDRLICRSPIIGASILISFLSSNWSKGLLINIELGLLTLEAK